MNVSNVKIVRAATLFAVLLTTAVSARGLRAYQTPPEASANGFSCPAPGDIGASMSGAIRHVRFLADDRLQGREVGSAAAHCAGDYIANAFASYGLTPAGDAGSWFQSFDVRVGSELGTHNLLRVAGREYTLHRDWVPLGFSGTGMAEATLVLAESLDAGDAQATAHGVQAESEHGNLAGRIVVLDGAPGDVRFAAAAAQQRGAAGLLLLVDQAPELDRDARSSVSIPVAAAFGSGSAAIRAAARAGERAELMAEVTPVQAAARNVLGLIEGTDPAGRGTIVVGAHFDHLGLGGSNSLAPDAAGQVHNGADDNASGTAALLEVARRMAASSSRPRPDVLFIAFTGEEKGLWGAGHYVKNPTLPIERTVAMINMDMIGRLGEGKLTIFGVATAEEWPELVEEVIAETDPTLPFVTAPDGFGPSDHSAFYGAGIPVLHFFTNTHADYHRPSDDWDRIDGVGLERVTAVVRAMTERLAGIDHPEAVALTPLSGAGDPSSGGVSSPDAPQQVSQSRGYGPYLGSIPDMTPQEGNGVRLTGVREASPAQLAGLRSGDVIVAFGGKEVTDLYAYTFALREHKPGDEVEIVVLRDGESVTLTAVLGRR